MNLHTTFFPFSQKWPRNLMVQNFYHIHLFPYRNSYLDQINKPRDENPQTLQTNFQRFSGISGQGLEVSKKFRNCYNLAPPPHKGQHQSLPQLVKSCCYREVLTIDVGINKPRCTTLLKSIKAIEKMKSLQFIIKTKKLDFHF